MRRTLGAGLATIASAAAFSFAAPAPPLAEEKAPDRAGFIPQRKYQALPGRIVGVLVGDVAKIMGNEGRSGPQDAMAFSSGGGSYRWTYVPAQPGASLIQNLQVKTGPQGDQVRIYPALNMANPTTVKELWGIAAPYALVEVEVNDKLGAPADEGFVATRMTALDGSRDFPIRIAETVEQSKKRFETWKQGRHETLDAAMLKAQKEAIGAEAPTGPRETQEMMHVSWMPEAERLRVRFLVRVTDGAYRYSNGAERDRPVPFPLPPVGGKGGPQIAPPPPPRFGGVRWGTQFGVEYGISFEIDKAGSLAKIQSLPAEGFKATLPPPPMAPIRPGLPIRD